MQEQPNHASQTVLNVLGDIPALHDGRMNLFAILDGAKDRRIEPLVRNSGHEYDCLYRDITNYALKRAAPHIVALPLAAEFTRDLLEQAWGQQWGIFALTPAAVTLADMRSHYRRLAKVSGPQGKTYVFRYYDPAVLSTLLPACDSRELDILFGPTAALLFDHGVAPQFAYRDSQPPQTLCTATNLPEHLAQRAAATTTGANRFTLRSAHIEALEARAEREHFRRLHDEYMAEYAEGASRECEIEGAPISLSQFLLRCYHQAQQFELDTDYSLLNFFVLTHTYGWEFWKKPDYEWAELLLTQNRFADSKIDRLSGKLSAQLMDQIWS